MVGTPGAPQEARAVPASDEAAGRRRDALLIGLTFAAGVVDAVSYLGLGQIFTANMTGNVVFLALAIGEHNVRTALHSVGALIVFSLAAAASGQILLRPRPPGHWPRRVTGLIVAELACLAAFAGVWASVGGRPDAGLLYLLIGLSSFGMGIQNAAARHLAVPGLTSTVVTGALTNFMVELPALGISGTAQRRGGLSIVALFAGAAIGATLIVYARPFAPIATVAIVAGVATAAYLAFDRHASGSHPAGSD
jgi:uncharacterized membrane protein YoaK (UPF0700 family)